MRRVLKSWDSKTATWNSSSGITTTEYGAANISAVGALDGNNWYVMQVNTMVKNILNGSATNYGWRIKDKTTEANNKVSTFCSSDYGYPYRPELVVNYTDSTVYCGNRAYESRTGSDTLNCMGYALDIRKCITPHVLSNTSSELKQIKSNADLLNLVNSKSIIYMRNYPSIGNSNFEVISKYNSYIATNRYRAVLRVGYADNDGVPGPNLDLPSSEWSSGVNKDSWDYHWWYQTNTGQWAEKSGGDPSRKITGTNSSTNPGASSNQSLWGSFYSSKCKYFAIKPNPNN